jgi:hypothetical protein
VVVPPQKEAGLAFTQPPRCLPGRLVVVLACPQFLIKPHHIRVREDGASSQPDHRQTFKGRAPRQRDIRLAVLKDAREVHLELVNGHALGLVNRQGPRQLERDLRPRCDLVPRFGDFPFLAMHDSGLDVRCEPDQWEKLSRVESVGPLALDPHHHPPNKLTEHETRCFPIPCLRTEVAWPRNPPPRLESRSPNPSRRAYSSLKPLARQPLI